MKRAVCVPLAMMLVWTATTLARAQRATPAGNQNASVVRTTRSAELGLRLESDVMTVFQALTDPRQLERWFPNRAILRAKRGSRFYFRWNDIKGLWRGTITELIPGNRLEFTWQRPGSEDATLVNIRLIPQGFETLVELTHSGFTSSDEMEKTIKDWVFYLENLKSVLEVGVDQRPNREAKGPTL